MRIQIRCISATADISAAVDQMDKVFAPVFAQLWGDQRVSETFGELAIFLSAAHPISLHGPDKGRGSYHKSTDTYFAASRLDYADWIIPDWSRRVEGYGEAVATAIKRIAKARLTDAERQNLLDINRRTIAEVLKTAPDVVTPLESIWLTYAEGNDSPSIGFGNKYGPDPIPGARCVEIKAKDAFSVEVAMPKREETLPSLPRMFRRDAKGLHFYEAFPHEKHIAEYEGVCGSEGENRFHSFDTPAQAAKIVSRLKAQAKDRGFRSVPMSKHKRLIVEYTVADSFADKAELDTRHTLEDFLDDWLGRLGLGHCDGGSSGQGTMEVCCYVVDFKLAKSALEPVLAASDFKAYSRIYLET